MLRIRTAGGSQHRGLYFYAGLHQIGRITVDPEVNVNRGPRLTVAFPVGWRDRGDGRRLLRLFEGCVTLPHLKWRYGAGLTRRSLFRVSSWFWHHMDGRYGWFGRCNR